MTPFELHEQLSDFAKAEDLYTARGQHRGCGQCCSRFIPLTMGEAVVLRMAAKDAYIRPMDGDYDLMCPFLTRDMECSVYDKRPEICRNYNCAEHKHLGGMAPFLKRNRHYEIYDLRELIA